MATKLEKATFAGGCFWCQDAVFRMLKGVKSVTTGYSGGDVENPTYNQVSSGKTGHREAVQIEYDPKEISYRDLLEVFWVSHNPTQKGGQGADTGSQYTAAIFYHTEGQKELAINSKKELEDGKVYDEPIATKILPYNNFYPAKEHYQNYYNKNPEEKYCKVIIDPKIDKIKKLFRAKLR